MANQEHLDIIKQGVDVWNHWREEHPDINPNLREADLHGANLNNAHLSRAHLFRANLNGADLTGADLTGAHLNDANLNGADLTGAHLFRANLSDAHLLRATLSEADLCFANLSDAYLGGANLSRANLGEANFREAYLRGADLTGAHLNRANLSDADLRGADLTGALLDRATLIGTNLAEATLTNCHIYGISAWGVQLEGANQKSLIITPDGEPTITVDNLKVAQFIYLLLNNAEIRDVIDTITSKVVLILGRFTPERKAVLDVLREELRKRNYSPVLFDFEKPASRDLTGTISTLANLARFIIVDLTDPSSAPHEVATVIPHTVVPVQPLLLREQLVVDGKEVELRTYSMFKDLQRRYHWVLPTYSYTDQAHLLATLQEHVIATAEQKAQELEKS